MLACESVHLASRCACFTRMISVNFHRTVQLSIFFLLWCKHHNTNSPQYKYKHHNTNYINVQVFKWVRKAERCEFKGENANGEGDVSVADQAAAAEVGQQRTTRGKAAAMGLIYLPLIIPLSPHLLHPPHHPAFSLCVRTHCLSYPVRSHTHALIQ